VNLPNRLTLLRLGLVPVFLFFLTIFDSFYTRVLALLVFIGAGVTDLFDGYIARKRDMVTTFGTFFDPIADKLLVMAAFIAFVRVHEFDVPVWMVVIMIAREFLILGLRGLAAARGRVIPADSWGKFKTAVQISAVILILFILIVISGLNQFGGPSLDQLASSGGWSQVILWTLKKSPFWLALAAALAAIISFFSYVYAARDLLREEKV